MFAKSTSSRTRLHHEAKKRARGRRAAERDLHAALHLGLALCAHLSWTTMAAHAQEAAAPPPPAADHEWYAWQTLSADAASVAFVVGGLASESAAPFFVGLGGYLSLTPFVHAVHHNRWALASLGLRAAWVATVLTANHLTTFCFSLGDEACRGAWPPYTGVAVVGLVGMAVTIGLDAVKADSRRVRTDAPSLGLWGDPLAGVAGVSVTLVR